MLPSGTPPQPPRQPSEAAYGSSGRAREVGAILRCVLTSYAIAARPHPLVRCEHAPESRRDTAAAAGRYTPTDPSPQISPPRHVRVPREAPPGPRARALGLRWKKQPLHTRCVLGSLHSRIWALTGRLGGCCARLIAQGRPRIVHLRRRSPHSLRPRRRLPRSGRCAPPRPERERERERVLLVLVRSYRGPTNACAKQWNASANRCRKNPYKKERKSATEGRRCKVERERERESTPTGKRNSAGA